MVLTDFFALSNHTLSYAAALAVPLEAQLVLLHVTHDDLPAPDIYRPTYPRWSEHKTALARREPAAG